jgi:hypothetical protein
MTYIILKVEGDWIILREDQLLLVNYDKKYISLISGEVREYDVMLTSLYTYEEAASRIADYSRGDSNE